MMFCKSFKDSFTSPVCSAVQCRRFLDAFCPSVRPSVTLLFRIRENALIRLLRKRGCQGEGEGERRGEGRGWASTDVPIALRDASDGRVSGFVMPSTAAMP